MKQNPDDRSDNVERIQKNINHTIDNMEAAAEMMSEMPDGKQKETIKDKNFRRGQALSALRNEIRDEARFQKEQDKK